MNNGDASPGASTPLSGLLACTRTIFALQFDRYTSIV